MTLPPFPVISVASQLSMVKFILPLAQDAANLSRTLGAIDTTCHMGCLAHEIVAVDDASRDGTAAEARRYAHFMPLWLIQHGRPLGRSLAFRTAVEAACRDVTDEDLLIPVDPWQQLDPRTALRAITAARDGHEAVIARAPATCRPGPARPEFQDVIVYRAWLVKQYLTGFLESAPSSDWDAAQQLDQYLQSVGVMTHRLATPALEQQVSPSLIEAIRQPTSLFSRPH